MCTLRSNLLSILQPFSKPVCVDCSLRVCCIKCSSSFPHSSNSISTFRHNTVPLMNEHYILRFMCNTFRRIHLKFRIHQNGLFMAKREQTIVGNFTFCTASTTGHWLLASWIVVQLKHTAHQMDVVNNFILFHNFYRVCSFTIVDGERWRQQRSPHLSCTFSWSVDIIK